MDIWEVIHGRRSVRAFRAGSVEETKLQSILEAANRAPSAGNLQAFEIYVARDAETRRELAEAAFQQDFVAEAPLVLVFCAHPDRSSGKYGKRGEQLYSLQDATIACTFAMLAATGEGLGTVWVGAFQEEPVRRVIGSPEGIRPIALLPVGYPSVEDPFPTSRRPLSDLVHEV